MESSLARAKRQGLIVGGKPQPTIKKKKKTKKDDKKIHDRSEQEKSADGGDEVEDYQDDEQPYTWSKEDEMQYDDEDQDADYDVEKDLAEHVSDEEDEESEAEDQESEANEENVPPPTDTPPARQSRAPKSEWSDPDSMELFCWVFLFRLYIYSKGRQMRWMYLSYITS